MKNKWLDNVDIPSKYLVTEEEIQNEKLAKYNIFKTELLNMFPNLSEDQIKEMYKEKV